jgi:hypothetical protein
MSKKSQQPLKLSPAVPALKDEGSNWLTMKPMTSLEGAEDESQEI